MKNRSLFILKSSGIRALFILSVCGFAAGICNGLLGAGGGVILVLALGWLLPYSEENGRSVYANALLVMLPLSCLTLWRYAQNGALDSLSSSSISLPLLLGAALGGVVGGVLLGKLKNKFTNRIFAILTLISGVLMLTR